MAKGFSDPVSLQGTKMERVETAVPAPLQAVSSPGGDRQDAGGSPWGASWEAQGLSVAAFGSV